MPEDSILNEPLMPSKYPTRCFLWFNVRETSPDKGMLFSTMNLLHLQLEIRVAWALSYSADLPTIERPMQLLCVRSVVCLGFPSSYTSRWTPLPLAMRLVPLLAPGTFTH